MVALLSRSSIWIAADVVHWTWQDNFEPTIVMSIRALLHVRLVSHYAMGWDCHINLQEYPIPAATTTAATRHKKPSHGTPCGHSVVS